MNFQTNFNSVFDKGPYAMYACSVMNVWTRLSDLWQDSGYNPLLCSHECLEGISEEEYRMHPDGEEQRYTYALVF